MKNKKNIIIAIIVIITIVIIIKIVPIGITKYNLLQFGSTTSTNNKKSSGKGSLSQPYSVNDTINFTAYEAQGYNYATGIRTVGNPVDFKISIEDKLFKMDEKLPLGYDDPLYLVGIKLECLSTTGDYTDIMTLSVNNMSLLTKDKKTVGHIKELFYEQKEVNETTKKYSYQITDNIYEGQTVNFLVGGYEKDLGISSVNDLELLKIGYWNEKGDWEDIYISLH